MLNVDVEKDSLTFFEPLKEESSLTRSTILQSVLGLFNFKKDSKDAMPTLHETADAKPMSPTTTQGHNPVLTKLQTTPTHKKPNHETPLRGGETPEKSKSAKKRRPGSLELNPVYKSREHLHGSEVEVRLKNFSTMFKDIPRMISGNNVQIMQQARTTLTSGATSSEGDLRQFWMPDEHCHECYECGDRFTTFRRRHHCRICGHIFCKRCCYLLIPGEVIGFHGMLRSCTYCYKLLTSQDPTSTKVNSHSLSMTEYDGIPDVYQNTQDTIGKSGIVPNDQTNMGSLKHVKSGRSRSLVSIHGSPVEEIPNHMNLTSPSSHDISMKTSAYEIFDATPVIARGYESVFENNSGNLSPERLHEIWAKIDNDRDGLEFRDHRFRLRKFTMTFTGSELVDWLMNNQESGTREQGCNIGQALLDSNWIKNIVDDRIFHDAYCLYQRGPAAVAFTESGIGYTTVTGSDDLVHVKKTSRLPLASLDASFALDSEPTWVREISNEDEDDGAFSDDLDSAFWTNVSPLYKPLQSQSDLHLSDEDSTSSTRSIHSVSSYVEIDQNTIKYKRPRDRVGVDGYSPHHTSSGLMPPQFVDESLTEISADYLRSYLAWNGMYQNCSWIEKNVVWRESNLHNANIPTRAKQAFLRLQKIYFRHSMLFLQQLLDSENLDRSWADIIVPLARRVCDSVIPDTDVNMNICHYVHVKRLLDGSPSESRLISGVVFTKNVVHNGMRTAIDKPVIMLIATPLEYQRKHYKLSTLEPIVQQENEFFKNLALRIAGRSPSVVISQCSVSHKARHLLAQAGISLVINVKQSVMEKLSRCTGADVARSIDQLQTVALGTCSRFRVTRHYNGQRSYTCSDGIHSKTKRNSKPGTTDAFKSLIYVEGCNASKGCTVILRESPSYIDEREGDIECRKRLSRVKDVFQFLIKILYHAKLEISYLMDQQDMAKSFPVPSKKDRKSRNPVQSDSLPDNVFVKSISVDSEYTECAHEYRHPSTLLNTASNSVSSIASDAKTLTPEHSDCDSGADATVTHPHATSVSHSHLQVPSKPLGVAVSDDRLTVSNAVSAKSSLFSESMHNVLLSISPFIQPNQPFLLTYRGEISPLRNYLPSTLFWSDIFCNQPGLTGKIWTKRNRKRTESTDRLDDVDGESSSFRSRSGTSESFVMPQNMWRTPQHQKSIESEFSNAYEEMLMAMESDEHLMDKENVGPQPRNTAFKDKSDVTSANSYLRKQISQASARSVNSRDDNRLTAWEKLIMHDVLASGSNRARMLGQRTTPRSSSPIGNGPHKSGPNVTSHNKFGGNTMTWKAVDHMFISTPLTMPAGSKEMKDLVADYRACGSALELVRNESMEERVDKMMERVMDEEVLGEEDTDSDPPLDCLDPRNHQHIFVLFSSYSTRSPNAPNPCVIPWAVDIDFYNGNDITLGGFLERYCFRPSYHCPSPTCKRPMVEHVRSFVHGTTCLNIVLKELAKPITVSDILSWSWDPVTHVTTDLKPLSSDAWSMSFAKFLELRLQTFNSPSQYQHIDEDVEPCIVPPFKSFQFFILRDIVASFKCFEISVFEIALPSPSIHFDKITDWRKSIAGGGDVDEDQKHEEFEEEKSEFQRMVNEMKILSKIGYEAMDSIHDLIVSSRSSNPLDQPSSSDQSEASTDVTSLNQMREKYFDDLLARYQEERYQMRDCVDKLHLKLQSIRLGQLKQHHALTEAKEEEEEADVMEEDGDTAHDTGEADIEIDELDRRELLRGLLELTCRICRVVHDWNATIGAVADMDRASRRGSKAVNLYSINPTVNVRKNPVFKNKESVLRKANSLKTVNEDAAEETSLGSSVDDDSAKLEDAPTTKQDSGEISNLPETSMESVTTTDGVSLSKAVLSRKSQLDKPEVRHSGVKRISRTASTVSILVSHLLTSSSHSRISPPFPSSEHYLLQNCVASQVVVRDSEPSSIIAYTLRTPEYLRCVGCANKVSEATGENGAPPGDESEDKTSATGGAEVMNEGYDDGDPIIDPHVEFKGTNSWRTDGKLGVTSSPMTSRNNLPHTEVEFEDSTSKFYCKVYFAAGFKALRAQILDSTEEDYISSLSRCVRWAARGGKSGSAFHKTLDDRLVLKQMSRFDLHSFLELAPSFFEYMTGAFKSKSPTALSKILGVYRVSFNNTTTNQSFKQDILVMENLFYKRNISQVFDLKGSVRNRHVKTDSETTSSFSNSQNTPSPASTPSIGSLGSTPSSRNNQVLLDENLLTIMRDHPLYIHEHTKMLIKKAITDDAHFLSSHEIIDYSLLVGIDEERKEIVVGIIDYMRTFTWDKKLEMHWKSIVPARHGARSMPTVVHPELYRSRFCEAMDRYFQVVPDRWFEMQAYKPQSCH